MNVGRHVQHNALMIRTRLYALSLALLLVPLSACGLADADLGGFTM
ncbi:hypothetical protein [Nonomuraea wenchangensis]